MHSFQLLEVDYCEVAPQFALIKKVIRNHLIPVNFINISDENTLAVTMEALPPQPPPFDTHKITDVYVKFIAVTVLLTVLSTSTVILRYLSRRATRSWSYDDWAILVALILAYGFLATTVIVGTVGGAGRHASEYTFPELERYLQVSSPTPIDYGCIVDFWVSTLR